MIDSTDAQVKVRGFILYFIKQHNLLVSFPPHPYSYWVGIGSTKLWGIRHSRPWPVYIALALYPSILLSGYQTVSLDSEWAPLTLEC